MTHSFRVKGVEISLIKEDITDLVCQAFLYYAREDLKLGSGFGTAISVRGGSSIQEELDKLGPLKTTEAVITNAGELKSDFIIHAVGPKFQEENIEQKLKETIINSLKAAEDKGISEIALPPMGAGFYGIPLDKCADIMIRSIEEYFAADSKIKKIIICANDSREYLPFQRRLEHTTAAA